VHHFVDGYNYLHRARLPVPRRLEEARSRLARRLAPLARGGGAVTIFWDARGRASAGVPGGSDREAVGGVEMCYCPGRDGADGAIRARLRAAPDPRSIRVVTDDAEVARAAKQLGARVSSVAAIEKRLAGRAPAEPADDDKPPPPGPDEIAGWLRYFGA